MPSRDRGRVKLIDMHSLWEVISDSSSEIGGASELVADGGLWAVSAVGCGVCGQVGYDSGEACGWYLPLVVYSYHCLHL